MSAWLLDDTPFHLLATVHDPAWPWPEGVITIVREIADTAANDRSGRRQALLQVIASTVSGVNV